jgi:hypothetical protein
MKPEEKKVEQKFEIDLNAVEKKVVKQMSALKPVCQNCKHYSRKTKQCAGTGGKFVPRKGTCEAFDKVTK